MLALVVHIGLFAFLWIGIRWQNETPLVVEAEIWDPKIREAAPLPEPVPDPVPDQVKPEPVKPEPVVKAPPPPKVDQPEVAKPDIALEKEKEKKRKEQEAKDREADRKKAEEKDRALKQQQQEKLDKEKQKAKDEAKEKKEEKDKDDKLAKQKADADAKKKQDAVDKLAADKRKKQDETDKKASDKRRQDDLNRMISQAGGNGDAAKSQGPRGNPAYASKVAAKIKQNTRFDKPDDVPGNPTVEYLVELLPDGSLRGLRKTKSSNVPGFDEAVQRGIEKSQPFPADTDGKVPGSFIATYHLKDM